MNRLIPFFLFIGVLSSCSYIDSAMEEPTEKPLVKVDDHYLYPSDIADIGRGLSPQDSTQNVEKFIHNWIRKEIVLSQAKDDPSINHQVIEDKLARLRRDLFIYEYEKNLTQQHIDTAVKAKDIEQFYKNNPANFELKQNIFQGYFIKIDKKSPSFSLIKKELKKGNSTQIDSLISAEAESYYIDSNKWHNFDDIARNTPFDKITDQKKYLTNTTFDIKYADKTAYILKVLQYKLSGETAPLEFHRDMIRNTLIHKRRRLFIKENEEKLYNKAKDEDRFEIYF